MEVVVKTQHLEIPRGYSGRLTRRFRRVFSSLTGAIQRVRVSLRTTSTRPGKEIKECRFDVSLRSGGQIVVTGRGSRMARAIGQTLRRARHLVRTEIKKRRTKQRRLSIEMAAPQPT